MTSASVIKSVMMISLIVSWTYSVESYCTSSCMSSGRFALICSITSRTPDMTLRAFEPEVCDIAIIAAGASLTFALKL